jgi:alanyl-tRNA synthetase
MALFGEKYGETVRVVDIGGPWSRELCAGTHVARSSEIGLINLVSESSVGSSNRRIESLVGLEGFRDLALERTIVSQLSANLKTPREQLPERIADLMASLKAAEKKIAEFQSAALAQRIPALIDSAQRAGGLTRVVANLGPVGSADDVRTLATTLRSRLGNEPGVVAIAAEVSSGGGPAKPVVIVATNEGARSLGVKAGALSKLAAGILGGGGGGKDDLAQGGGTDTAAIGAALDAIAKALPA